MPRRSDLATRIAGGILPLVAAWLLYPSPALAQDCAAPEDEAVIEDDALKEAIKDQLGLTTAEVSCGAMLKLRELHARNAGISSLAGLDRAAALRLLDVTRNRIANLEPLAQLSELTELRLDQNLIEDLGPLLKNTRIGAGVSISVRDNCLDLTTDSDDRQAIDTLTKRGASVQFRTPKTPAACAKKP